MASGCDQDALGMPVPEWGLRVVMVVRQRQRGLGRDAGAAQRRRSAADCRCRPRRPRPACRRTPPADGSRRPRSGARRRVPATSGPGAAAPPSGSGGPGTPTLVTTASTSAQPAGGSRSGRQQAAIADPALVLHHDFHVARQRQVLQAVVRDDHVHVGMRAQQRLGSQRALGMHRDRRAGARDQGGSSPNADARPAPRHVRRAARGRSSRRSLG